MSLRVWLPLNGSLENKGLDDVTVTNNGAVVDNNGKIGKCYSFGTENSYITVDSEPIKHFIEFSFACWVKIISWNSAYATIFAIKNSAGIAWNNLIFSLSRESRSYFLDFNIDGSNGYTSSSCHTKELSLNTWYHIAGTYRAGEIKLYQDGILVSTYETAIVPAFNAIDNFWIGKANANSYQSNILLNDFRIYDHALSPMEVKQISQGLVLHYPLNSNSIQILNNCYTNPRFETSGTGWNRWGSSGHQGSGGWTDDQNYCFRNDNTGAYWVANGAEATKNYLLYQSPAFEEEGGGFRSLQCICKEENGIKITDNVCFPDWNSRNGGVPTGHWTSIENLGNGFYLCKCEGISQSGSDNLIGVYIKPGYKVYFSEIYVENYRTVCSDIFFPDTTVYDTSGYNNNGTAIGNLECSSDTPRYDVSTHFGATNSKIRISNLITTGFSNSYTFSWWGKYTTLDSSMFWGFQNGVRLNGVYLGIYWNTGDGHSNPIYKPGTTTVVTAPEANVWHHYVMTGDNTVCKLYVDGELYGQAKVHKTISGNIIYINGWDSGTSYSFTNMDMSDFRIYATALSPEDVFDLYNLGAAIDTNNNLYTYEVTE